MAMTKSCYVICNTCTSSFEYPVDSSNMSLSRAIEELKLHLWRATTDRREPPHNVMLVCNGGI